jgi:hypothetical protein
MDNEAYIQLVLKGPNVSIKDAEELADVLRTTLMMVSGGVKGFSISVGQITLRNEVQHGG